MNWDDLRWHQIPAVFGSPERFHLMQGEEIVGVIVSSSTPRGGYSALLKGVQVKPLPKELPHGFWINLEDAMVSIAELAGRCRQ